MKSQDISTKNYKKRNALIKLLEEENRPLQVKEIYDKLKRNNVPMYISTIYRSLSKLEKCKKIIKTNVINEEGAYYEINKNVHKHFVVCTKCKSITYLTECPLKNIESDIKELLDFKVMDHKLELYGLCKNCLNKNGGAK